MELGRAQFILASWAIRSFYVRFGAMETTEEFKAGSDMIRYTETGLEMTRVEKRPVRKFFSEFQARNGISCTRIITDQRIFRGRISLTW